VRQSVATWSAIRGLRVRIRAIAPWATTQYRQRFAALVATTISSRSPLLSAGVSLSISASW
jgi:hypothetical protein